MDKLDGNLLSIMRQWRCTNNQNHVLGVVDHVEVTTEVKRLNTILKYKTSRLIVFHNAIDLSSEIPTEIEVAGSIDGKMLNMMWKCSICKCGRSWNLTEEEIEWLIEKMRSRRKQDA